MNKNKRQWRASLHRVVMDSIPGQEAVQQKCTWSDGECHGRSGSHFWKKRQQRQRLDRQ
jgi:hypothetical protein